MIFYISQMRVKILKNNNSHIKAYFFDHSQTLPEGIDWVIITRGCPEKQKHACALYVYSLNYTCNTYKEVDTNNWKLKPPCATCTKEVAHTEQTSSRLKCRVATSGFLLLRTPTSNNHPVYTLG